MLRIPGSLNSRYVQLDDRGKIIGDIPPEAEVRIIEHGDGRWPSIEPLLTPYYIWSQAEAIKEIQRRRREEQKSRKYRLQEILHLESIYTLFYQYQGTI